tara:strand:+ start:39198 stop:39377 length:180 start_codon:yes stop_codon:yes gene_type:complete
MGNYQITSDCVRKHEIGNKNRKYPAMVIKKGVLILQSRGDLPGCRKKIDNKTFESDESP